MSTHLEEKLEKILEIFDQLAKESAKGTPIVVEGINDVSALRQLSISGKIIPVKASGKNFIDMIDELVNTEKREIIVLMDFDRHGRELAKRMTQHLQELKIKPNMYFWNRFLKLVGRNVKDIEGLASYLETLKKEIR
ncbi:MAG: toprim domain-containing protein [Candidatus Bathyarchaeota archaeon]|nr:toprim domain-containing protein [Candidatus Bathyarchaeota archaeon]MDH5733354.1 toprim domain-containing protein [Candidatus Bathyarchaeota archaeon]